MQKKNNFKKCLKIFAGAFLALTVFTVSVCAAAPTAEIEDNKITVTYTDTGAGFGTFVYVFDTVLEADAVVDQALIDSNLVWTDIVKGGTAEIVLPDGADYGAYTVLLGAKGMPASKADKSVVVLYKKPGIEAEAMEAITGAKTADAMAEQIEAYNKKAYIIDTTKLDAQKGLIFEAVAALGASATLDEFVAAVESAGKLSEIVEADVETAAKILKENKAALGLTDDIEKYDDVVAAAVLDRINANSTMAEIKAAAKEELALAALNGASKSNILETIEKYNDIFKVTFSSKLDYVDEYDVENALAGIVFDDVTKVEDIVNDAINDVYDEQKKEDKKNKGYSGGGGGGGRRGAYAVISTLEQPEVKEINGDEDLMSGINDIEGYDWAKEAIEYLYANSIMTGDGDGRFRPGDNLTREEFVKLIIAAIGGNKLEDGIITFTDISEGAWYKKYVETAVVKGITTGISEGEFGVGQYITRQDAAVMLLRAAEAYYTNFKKKTTLIDFTDYDTVSDYAVVAVDTLARAQIINGFEDGSFRPQDNITRAEIAKVIYACIAQ